MTRHTQAATVGDSRSGHRIALDHHTGGLGTGTSRRYLMGENSPSYGSRKNKGSA
jgi:hypothetical protein